NRLWLAKAALVFAAAFLLLPLVLYLAAYSQFFLMGFSLHEFADLQKQMYWYHTGLKATHPYASDWWEWPLLRKPVWYYVDYNAGPDKISNIFGMGNPLIFWAFLPAVAFALWEWIEDWNWARFAPPWEQLPQLARTAGIVLLPIGFLGLLLGG